MFGLILTDGDNVFIEYYGSYKTVNEAQNKILKIIDNFYTEYELIENSATGNYIIYIYYIAIYI